MIEVSLATAEALCCSATIRVEDGAEVVAASGKEGNVALLSATADSRVSIGCEPGDVVSMLAVFEGTGKGELKASAVVV